MRILPITTYTSVTCNKAKSMDKVCRVDKAQTLPMQISSSYMPRISFRSRLYTNTIEFEDYQKMLPEEKEFYRKLYDNYYKNIDKTELHYPATRNHTLPLVSEIDMDDFIRVSSCYNKYRNNQIICVGRSPKWFLNTALWMKDGIEEYSFNAFSSNWYDRDKGGLGPNLTYKEESSPTYTEYACYREYMARQKTDPLTIIRRAQRTGKPAIITDYIHSGCGLTSYLDLASKYAKDEGVLNDFIQSIKLLTLSSIEYITGEDYLDMSMYTSVPKVLMPPLLKDTPVEQEYHDMTPDVLKDILISKNTNECRSSYYPPAAWTVYSPVAFKTGMLPDSVIKNMEKKVKGFKQNYTNAMRDYRNLMNFRILDALNTRNLLKKVHVTR